MKLPSLYGGTTSGFFSSYISSDWLNGSDIFSLIGRFPGRDIFVLFIISFPWPPMMPPPPLPPMPFSWWPCSCICWRLRCWCVRSLMAAIVPNAIHIRAVNTPINMPTDRIGVNSNWLLCVPVFGGWRARERERELVVSIIIIYTVFCI